MNKIEDILCLKINDKFVINDKFICTIIANKKPFDAFYKDENGPFIIVAQLQLLMDMKIALRTILIFSLIRYMKINQLGLLLFMININLNQLLI